VGTLTLVFLFDAIAIHNQSIELWLREYNVRGKDLKFGLRQQPPIELSNALYSWCREITK
jgi:hypothetical protein